jgi:hypothetical protein
MVLNHNPVPVIVDTGGNYTDLLTGGKINNKLELEPYGVSVLV